MTATTKPRPKAAAAKAAQARRRRRRTVLFGSVGGVLAIVAAIVAIALTSGGTSSSGTASHAVPAAVMQGLTGVPAATLNAVGAGTGVEPPTAINDAALVSNGKPEVLYVGAEYCPYCAAQRWPLIQALSRFGTFTGLRTTTSPSNETFPNTSTFTFHGATYQSDYLTFVGREMYTSEIRNGNRVPLDALTPDEAALFHKYSQGYPFVDMGGRYVQPGVSYGPAVLQGKSWQDIVNLMADPSSQVAQTVDGSANALTAALCQLTKGQPAAVCTAPGVTTAAKTLHH